MQHSPVLRASYSTGGRTPTVLLAAAPWPTVPLQGPAARDEEQDRVERAAWERLDSVPPLYRGDKSGAALRYRG